MTQNLNIKHLPPEAIHSLMTHLPDYVKVALVEKATQLECSLEAAIPYGIASLARNGDRYFSRLRSFQL